jgi:hypothetical protein
MGPHSITSSSHHLSKSWFRPTNRNSPTAHKDNRTSGCGQGLNCGGRTISPTGSPILRGPTGLIEPDNMPKQARPVNPALPATLVSCQTHRRQKSSRLQQGSATLPGPSWGSKKSAGLDRGPTSRRPGTTPRPPRSGSPRAPHLPGEEVRREVVLGRSL